MHNSFYFHKCILTIREYVSKKNKFWKNYHQKNHTSTYELAEIATKTKPGLLLLYHILFWGTTEADLLDEISEKYNGKVVVGKDLMVID